MSSSWQRGGIIIRSSGEAKRYSSNNTDDSHTLAANEHLLLEESLAVFWLEVLLLESFFTHVNQHLLDRVFSLKSSCSNSPRMTTSERPLLK